MDGVSLFAVIVSGLLGVVLIFWAASLNDNERTNAVFCALFGVIFLSAAMSSLGDDARGEGRPEDTLKTGIYTVRVCDLRVERVLVSERYSERYEDALAQDCILRTQSGRYLRYIFSASYDRDAPRRDSPYPSGTTLEMYELDGTVYVRAR